MTRQDYYRLLICTGVVALGAAMALASLWRTP